MKTNKPNKSNKVVYEEGGRGGGSGMGYSLQWSIR